MNIKETKKLIIQEEENILEGKQTEKVDKVFKGFAEGRSR